MQTTLTGADVKSKTWLKLRDWAEAEIADLRKRNDNPEHGPVKTAELRGRIAQLLEMLSLADAAGDSSDEPLVVFNHTSTSSVESALTG